MKKPLRVLIVEDEFVTALDISDALHKSGFEVVKCVNTYEKAIECIEKKNPDFLILDIILNGSKSGIDIANYLTDQHQIPFIFLTSSTDERIFGHALKSSPGAYLIKPFTREELHASITLAVHNFHEKNRISQNADGKMSEDFIEICDNQKPLRLYFNEIAYAKSDHVYMELNTSYGQSYLLRSTMDALLQKLSENFCRIHRSYIVNCKHIREVKKNKLKVLNTELPIGKQYAHCLESKM